MDKVGYGLRTDGRGMGGLEEWVGGWGGEREIERDSLLMGTEMVNSIVMYNLGDGHRGPYISANLECHQSNFLFWLRAEAET
jgi:hypothetical protein